MIIDWTIRWILLIRCHCDLLLMIPSSSRSGWGRRREIIVDIQMWRSLKVSSTSSTILGLLEIFTALITLTYLLLDI